MKGTTLLETMVVMSIISLLSLTGVNTINNFRREASLDNAANELVSEIRTARSKSMNGEILDEEDESDFVIDLDDGSSEYKLPEYGISFDGDKYQLIRRCVKNGVDCASEEPLETVNLDSDHIFTSPGNIFFERITGKSDPITEIITISEKAGTVGRTISISENFKIEIQKI